MQKKEYIYPQIEVVALEAENRMMKGFDISNSTPEPEGVALRRIAPVVTRAY